MYTDFFCNIATFSVYRITYNPWFKLYFCFHLESIETKNSGLRFLVSRRNRSVDQLGREPRTSRL